MAKKITYAEPVDFIPKEVRKKLELGEFSPAATPKSNSGKSKGKATPKKSK